MSAETLAPVVHGTLENSFGDLRVRFIYAPFILAMTAIAPASASTIIHSFDFTIDDCTGGCGTGPFGTVTVSQTDAQALLNTMSIDVSLSPGVDFVHTGAGDALMFDIAGNPAITITGLTAGFTAGQIASGGSIHAGATGYWEYTITCTACGHGGSNPQPGPLDFDITTASALTPDDLIQNDAGLFFAADVLGTSGNTGMVASDRDPPQPTDVPEPGSAALFATALSGVGLLIRRRHAAL